MSQRSICRIKTNPGTKPAVLEIGKGRGSGEAASQYADAAFSTIEGRRDVELIAFRRLAVELQRGTWSLAAASAGGWRPGKRGNFGGVVVRIEDRPTVQQSMRTCC